MEKYLRKYEFFAEDRSGLTREFRPPFTLEFDVNRNILASANTSTIRLYNLAKETREALYKDRYKFDEYRAMELRAGYGDTIPTIFKGNMKLCNSVRQGVNQITTFEGFDGGFAFANGRVSTSFPKGTPQNTILEEITKTMPKVTLGAIGDFKGNIQRGNAYDGASVEILNQISDGALFVDNERAYFLGDSEVIPGSIDLIDPSAGLLSSPVKEDTFLNFDMIFEPRFLIGQQVELRSVTNPQYNGFYKIIGLHHTGTISEAISGNATTKVSLFYGINGFTEVPLKQ